MKTNVERSKYLFDKLERVGDCDCGGSDMCPICSALKLLQNA